MIDCPENKPAEVFTMNMRHLILRSVASGLLLFFGLAPVKGAATNLVGTVLLHGTPPPPSEQRMKENMCGNPEPFVIKSRQYVVGTNGGLADVFVYIRSGSGVDGRVFDPAAERPVLNQIRCEFQPYAFGVMTGQVFTVRHSDPVLHNAHFDIPRISFSTRRTYPIAKLGNDVSMSLTNSKVAVQVRCDVHPWMLTWVGVFSNPFFAVTDGSGRFAISGLPPGSYELVVYHPKTHGKTEGIVTKIEVKAGEIVSKDFTVELPAK